MPETSFELDEEMNEDGLTVAEQIALAEVWSGSCICKEESTASYEDKIRIKFNVPINHKLKEISGWWNTVNADIRVWIEVDDNDQEIDRFKREHFIGDIPMYLRVES